jgi:hypothetical protein
VETLMKQLRISPAQLGAVPCRDYPNCWLLSQPDQQEMRIACAEGENELFVATVRIATLLPEAQAYQLAAALMLNRDWKSLAGGAVAYDVHSDSFLYCKGIDARMLVLSSFRKQVDESFATARTLRELMRHAQEDIGPRALATSMPANIYRLIRGTPP